MKTFPAGLLWLVLAGAPANAAVPAAEMFAYGAKLEVTGQHAFYQLELPLEVYQTLTRRDLGDLRVFNAAGQVVPHALRRPENTSVRKDVVTAELPFFPIRGETGAIDGNLSIHVERNPQGTIIDVRAAEPKESTATGPIRAYLVDGGSLNRPIDALELAWADRGEDFLGELKIETSDDLRAWRPLATAAVASLSYQGYQLDRSRVELPRPNARYLRISWPDNRPPAEVSNVIALAHQSTTTSQPPRRWLKIKSMPVAGLAQVYLADLEGFLPVDRIQIRLAETNSLAAARLSSGDSASASKREHWRGLAYNLQVDGKSVSNPAIIVTPTTSRYWTLTIDGSETTLRSAPQLEFGWQPARLVFLAWATAPSCWPMAAGTSNQPDFPLRRYCKTPPPRPKTTCYQRKLNRGRSFPSGEKANCSPPHHRFPGKPGCSGPC